MQPPPPIPGIERTTTIKILGVTITNSVSVCEHIRTVIGSWSIVRADNVRSESLARTRHGWCRIANRLQRSVVIVKLKYASSAWWGFTNTSDRQRVEASIRHSARIPVYVWRTVQSRRRTAVQQHRRQQTPRSAPSTAAEIWSVSILQSAPSAYPTLNYQNVVRVSQTRLVTLNACYSRIFTKIMLLHFINWTNCIRPNCKVIFSIFYLVTLFQIQRQCRVFTPCNATAVCQSVN